MLEGDISSIVISYVYQCFYTMKKKKDKSRNPRFDCAYRAYARLLVVARIRRVTIAFQSATKREPQQYRAITQHAITNCRQACRCRTSLGHHNQNV